MFYTELSSETFTIAMIYLCFANLNTSAFQTRFSYPTHVSVCLFIIFFNLVSTVNILFRLPPFSLDAHWVQWNYIRTKLPNKYKTTFPLILILQYCFKRLIIIEVIYCCVIVFAAAVCGGGVSEKTAVPGSAVRGQIRSLSRPPKVHSSRL